MPGAPHKRKWWGCPVCGTRHHIDPARECLVGAQGPYCSACLLWRRLTRLLPGRECRAMRRTARVR